MPVLMDIQLNLRFEGFITEGTTVLLVYAMRQHMTFVEGPIPQDKTAGFALVILMRDRGIYFPVFTTPKGRELGVMTRIVFEKKNSKRKENERIYFYSREAGPRKKNILSKIYIPGGG